MVDPAKLKELRQLTNAGLADCKRVLDDSGGDLFAAAVSILTESDVKELKQSMLVRSSAGQSIKDPVTDRERQLIEALEAHFIGKRTRPVNIGFLFETTSLFLVDSQFRVAIMDQPENTLKTVWNTLASDSSRQAFPKVTTVETKKVLSTLITMPTPESEWESDYVVLMPPRRRLIFSSSARVIAIYKRTKRPDRGVANIEEMTGAGKNVRTLRHWVHQDIEFTPRCLGEITFASQLREVT
ncbi:hypothetical protein SH528x_003173 [Novipirellula sp. SH528]|uniref:hypothetical protein n=1 Tax=Novipirellula sp. SH528 TaxID=3454466 RepID=UPI003FA09AEC